MDQMTVCGSQPDVEPQVQQPSPQHPEASSLISIRICGLQTLKPIWSSGTHMRFLALVLMHYYGGKLGLDACGEGERVIALESW